MIAESKYTFTYLCWKCKRKYPVEQTGPHEQKGLKCPKCGRVLFRVEKGPNVSTDTTFMAGSHVDDGFGTNEWSRKQARAKAKAAGVDINGARYCPQLCPQGESLSPKAWVRGKADVKRRCQELGVGCEGSVKVPEPSHEFAEPKPYRVADSIVNDRVQREIEGKHFSKKEIADLREKTAKRLSGGDN